MANQVLTDADFVFQISNVGVTEFCQGRTMRWGLGWTFDESVTFPVSVWHVLYTLYRVIQLYCLVNTFTLYKNWHSIFNILPLYFVQKQPTKLKPEKPPVPLCYVVPRIMLLHPGLEYSIPAIGSKLMALLDELKVSHLF